MLRLAALAEAEKITGLREGLKGALSDVQEDLKEVAEALKKVDGDARENDRKQNALLAPHRPDTQNGFACSHRAQAVLSPGAKQPD